MNRAPRIHELDSLRGFALAGIVMVNIIQITGMPETRGESADHPGVFAFELFFLQRPFLIFSVLFGISFAIFLTTAEKRTDRPRLILLRRLLFLGVLGGLHTFLQPGEVLKFYAALGIIVLLPASYLSRRWVLGLGIMLTLASAVTLAGVTWIPGLFLLGMAAARYGLPGTLDRRGRQLGIAFGVALALSIILGIIQFNAGVGPTAHYRSLPAGLAVAALLAFGFLLLLRTPARRVLDPVFAPMGRMTLTNYILATVLILAGDAVWHFGDRTDYGRVVVFGVGVAVVQAVLSPMWMKRFQYGPLEWAWRCLTWWQLVPIRKEPVAGSPSAATPSAATPSAATPSAATPSAATPSAATPSAATPSAATPSAATPSAAGSRGAADRPDAVTGPGGGGGGGGELADPRDADAGLQTRP